MTWEQFCAGYKPGEYGRDATPEALQRDADTVLRVLATAHRNMRQLDEPVDRRAQRLLVSSLYRLADEQRRSA